MNLLTIGVGWDGCFERLYRVAHHSFSRFYLCMEKIIVALFVFCRYESVCMFQDCLSGWISLYVFEIAMRWCVIL